MPTFQKNLFIHQLTQEELQVLFNYNNSQLHQIEETIAKNPDDSDPIKKQMNLMDYQKEILSRLSVSKPKKAEISYDTQSILSSSSVTKKTSKLLVDIPEGYFGTNPNK